MTEKAAAAKKAMEAAKAKAQAANLVAKAKAQAAKQHALKKTAKKQKKHIENINDNFYYYADTYGQWYVSGACVIDNREPTMRPAYSPKPINSPSPTHSAEPTNTDKHSAIPTYAPTFTPVAGTYLKTSVAQVRNYSKYMHF
jgi:hypothetical protein